MRCLRAGAKPNPASCRWCLKATAVTVTLCIPFVACEVFFDDLRIELAEAQVAAPVATNPNPSPPAPNTNPPAPGADPNSPAALADKAPKKTLEDGGMLFGPTYAKALQKSYPSKSVNAGVALFVGSGFNEKDPVQRLSAAWKPIPFSVKLP